MAFSGENRTKNRQKGDLSENIACKYLRKRGFEIRERNYRKPWGELDIIAVKDSIINFFEVKSITVAHLTAANGRVLGHRPEENVTAFKLKQIRKMVRTYLFERRIGNEIEFQFHVISVYLDTNRRLARVHWIKNLIL